MRLIDHSNRREQQEQEQRQQQQQEHGQQIRKKKQMNVEYLTFLCQDSDRCWSLN
jgi:hypothetical protein